VRERQQQAGEEVGSTDEVAGEQQDIYVVLEEVATGMEDGRRDPTTRKLLAAVSDTRGRKREGDDGFRPRPDRGARTAVGWRASDRVSARCERRLRPRPDRGGRFNGVAHTWRAWPQLGTSWATPPDKRAQHRPQSH
jgi:hypothetical protein